MNDKLDLDQVRAAYQALPENFKSLLMATVSADGYPEASYAPYVHDKGNFYVYISELAAHTSNLRDNNRVGLLFIEDEDKAANIFARQRVTFKCTAFEIERDSDGFENVLTQFEYKFGKFFEQLRKMLDFHLYCITPYKGTFVQGFARAFTIEGHDLDQIRHVNDVGHRGQVPDSNLDIAS